MERAGMFEVHAGQAGEWVELGSISGPFRLTGFYCRYEQSSADVIISFRITSKKSGLTIAEHSQRGPILWANPSILPLIVPDDDEWVVWGRSNQVCRLVGFFEGLPV